jgi:CheY-like chemotaxis protein
MCEELLDRAKDVAVGITDRIRALLEPETTVDEPDTVNRMLRVLCVDDNHDAADMLSVVVTLLGCKVYTCYDGPSALRAVRDFRPDLCLLDLMMPGMDGVQVAAQLRLGAGSRPLVLAATTALGSLAERTMTAVTGFHFHLIKPIDLASLRETIDRVRNLLHFGERHYE